VIRFRYTKRMQDMDEKYWEKFVNSGKIEDYLSFRAGMPYGREEIVRAREDDDAGTYMGNRDYFKTVSGGRVRQTHQPFD